VIALVLMAALAADGGPDAPFADAGPVDYGCPASAAVAVPVDGGVFLPEARAERLACLLVATEKHRDLLLEENKGTVRSSIAWAVAAAAIVVAFAGGISAGMLVEQSRTR